MTRRLLFSVVACFTASNAVADDVAPVAETPVAEPPAEPPVAEPLAPKAEPAEPPATATDDVDLASLVLDPSEGDNKLNIYGFTDVSWRKMLQKGSDLTSNFFPKESTFLVGNLNLYLTKNMSPRWRTLIELRFLYAPNGTKNPDGTLTEAAAPDPADLERPISWGGISIERAYLEYEIDPHLTIRAGAFLTPYGIWNVDHGSPTIIPVTRPFIIGENLFPDQQTGLHVYGKHPLGEYQIGYHATLSNGRGPFQGFRDLDENKALGARLELEAPWLDGVQLGISAYGGRFTKRPADKIITDSEGNLINSTPRGVQYDEIAWGVDALIHRGPLHVQLEVLVNDRAYLSGARDRDRVGFRPDGRYLGGYLLAGYRFNRFWQVMPFAVVEYDQPRSSADFGESPKVYQAMGGLNFRPDPSVVLKLNYAHARIFALNSDFTIRAFMAQAAWAF
ncbi:MAG: OprO/OprP family phosphate-selective porin [Myxococcota bacterium]|nr:OprO/OprP family phosphate-selective porin [Myxococcota bacterium]